LSGNVTFGNDQIETVRLTTAGWGCDERAKFGGECGPVGPGGRNVGEVEEREKAEILRPIHGFFSLG
jgi:hypothetical protein